MTTVTMKHRYRIAKGIYPEPMVPVVIELCGEIERLQQKLDEATERIEGLEYDFAESVP